MDRPCWVRDGGGGKWMLFWWNEGVVGVVDVTGFETTRFVAGDGGGGIELKPAAMWPDVMRLALAAWPFSADDFPLAGTRGGSIDRGGGINWDGADAGICFGAAIARGDALAGVLIEEGRVGRGGRRDRSPLAALGRPRWMSSRSRWSVKCRCVGGWYDMGRGRAGSMGGAGSSSRLSELLGGELKGDRLSWPARVGDTGWPATCCGCDGILGRGLSKGFALSVLGLSGEARPRLSSAERRRGGGGDGGCDGGRRGDRRASRAARDVGVWGRLGTLGIRGDDDGDGDAGFGAGVGAGSLATESGLRKKPEWSAADGARLPARPFGGEWGGSTSKEGVRRVGRGLSGGGGPARDEVPAAVVTEREEEEGARAGEEPVAAEASAGVRGFGLSGGGGGGAELPAEAVRSGRGDGGRRSLGCSERGPGEGWRGTEGGAGDDGGGVSAAGLLMFSKRARRDETGFCKGVWLVAGRGEGVGGTAYNRGAIRAVLFRRRRHRESTG